MSQDVSPARIRSAQTLITFWRNASLRTQLLWSVNLALGLTTIVFMVVNYHLGFAEQLQIQRLALTEEAKTIYEAIAVVLPSGKQPAQELVDNVCARMSSEDSPGHHIAFQNETLAMQAVSHGRHSSNMLHMMQEASQVDGKAGAFIVGSFSGPTGTVYVSESTITAEMAARKAKQKQ